MSPKLGALINIMQRKNICQSSEPSELKGRAPTETSLLSPAARVVWIVFTLACSQRIPNIGLLRLRPSLYGQKDHYSTRALSPGLVRVPPPCSRRHRAGLLQGDFLSVCSTNLPARLRIRVFRASARRKARRWRRILPQSCPEGQQGLGLAPSPELMCVCRLKARSDGLWPATCWVCWCVHVALAAQS